MKEKEDSSTVDLSKLNIQIYDLLALLVPGLALLALIAFTTLGWTEFLWGIQSLNGPLITVVLLAGFTLGHLVQQFSDTCLRFFGGERFFQAPRDKMWTGDDAELLKKAILADGGSISSADAAFAFCLSKVQATFSKRGIFLATADFSRAMATISILGLAAVARAVHDHSHSYFTASIWGGAGIVAVVGGALLFWQRMIGFRDYSEIPVFYAYLAQRSEDKNNVKR